MELSERIKLARINSDEASKTKEQERLEYISSLRNQITNLSPRIHELIKTANILIDYGFYKDFLYTGGKNNYKGFCSESWKHHVGFIPDFINGKKIKYMGIINGGACGEHDFLTNGTETFMTTANSSSVPSDMELNVSNAKRFIESFDDFENRFYKGLDEFLNKMNA